MSRRKQSKPRQIKRSPGDLDGIEENTPDNLSLSGEEGGVSDPDDSAEGDNTSPLPYTPLYNEEPKTQDSLGGPSNEDEDRDEQGPIDSGGEDEEEGEEEEETLHWRGPDDLELRDEGGDSRVVAARELQPGTTWGPYPGVLQSEGSTDDRETENPRLTLVCEDPDCWVSHLPLTSDPSTANCIIYTQGDELFCKVTRDLAPGQRLLASLSLLVGSSSPLPQLSPPLSLVTQKQPMVKEEPLYPSALRSDIQLLPQQAGMASILATAVVNKDIFPCKDCGIWYRSERNLHAHLMYYCASRQKQPATASSPPQDKPKDSYPNERICPFPQCNKSCPSASSLEIHMRTHSGERPFVCLICLSAFTTKANCERHLKVHTDTLNGVCHGCGFVSTTRDILYSHLVTSHMVCQPGSRSEVYSPGPGLPKLPLSTGLSPGDTGVVLKCQVCGHNSDSPSQLQQHVRTHLEVRVPSERSPTPRQITPSLIDHPQLQPSSQESEPLACVPKPDSSSPGANGGSATPRDYSPQDASVTDLKIKEEPHSDSEKEEQQVEIKEDEEEEEDVGEEDDQEEKSKTKEGNPSPSSCQASNSPKSPATTTVKAEPTSPTPGSSPAHLGGTGSVLQGGAMFLPQYMFNPEAAILPQASEILAKMSEMVHSRLKQGQAVPQNNPAAFFPSGPTAPTTTATPPHKGATCFECDITFNNINNFYAHKRLYCSSRHQAEGATSASGSGSTRDAAPAIVPSCGAQGSSASPQGGVASRAPSASPTDSDPTAGSGAAESRRVVEVKTEAPGGREGISSSSEGEGGGASAGGGGGGRTSEGSQSPASGSAEDLEDDPNRTFCEACNIRFSRHDNYTVHKRFYCASRHDPTNQRAIHTAKATNTAAFLPQPIRTRKRKKMYEIHMARTEALANAAAAAATAATATATVTASAPSPSILGLAVKQEVSPSGADSSSPEGDGPIDLSKRPRIRDAPRHNSSSILPALPLTDYHKCTACSISFNSIENYLAHKTYYCPATTLQPHTLEQLHRLKRSASTSPKSRSQQERPDLLYPMEAKGLPAEWVAQTQGTSPSPHPSALSSSNTTSPPPTNPGAGAKGVGTSSHQMVCPYCPNRPITCDIMEHFKTTHGLVVTIQPPQETLPQPGSAVSRSPSLSPRDGAAATTSTTPNSQTRLVSRVNIDSINGQSRSGTTSPVSPLVNGSPSAGVGSPLASSPLPVSPPRALSLTLSPVPEVLRETVGSSHLPDKVAPATASHPISTPQLAPIPDPKTPVVSSVQNGNSRFCRLCNIKFSSLSTFIAHKKYYCSSHSAEHVK
ncbi:zinc finger protein ZFPM1 [Mastacembelus armatus]|uniref:Zinc finger protein, FOG family member 1 n=1 Tax=Mastacembelus armatus TaxID=205130 RepID=A0A3Q3LXY4_9TELE|nr:zinc finger protein ZFPM1 [Mastacembelus armatus]